MSLALNDLSEWFLIDASWLGLTDFVVRAVPANNKQLCEIVFRRVTYLKVLASTVPDITKDNEIWSFEELASSPLVEKVRLENSSAWLQETFGTDVRSQRTGPVEQLHHIVLLADYLHFELLCLNYSLKVVALH
jgi:hypothetical protein